jgi:hypothetical protein
MTKGDLAGVKFFGRPFKPVAMGLGLAMVIIVSVNVTDTGRLGSGWLGDVVAITAALSLVFLVGGWWGKWQRWAEFGLAAAFLTYVMRGVFLSLTIGIDQSMWFSFSTAFIAGGAYMLEATDHTVER